MRHRPSLSLPSRVEAGPDGPVIDARADIAALVTHFVTQFSHRMGKQVDNIPPDTMAAFQWYSWPGNIRELQNLVERAVILSRGGVLPNSLHKIRIEVMPPRNIVFPLAHHR